MPPFYPNQYHHDPSQPYQHLPQYYPVPSNQLNHSPQVVIPQRQPPQPVQLSPQYSPYYPQQQQQQSHQINNSSILQHQTRYYPQSNYTPAPTSVNIPAKASPPQYYHQQAVQYNANQINQYGSAPPQQLKAFSNPQYYQHQNLQSQPQPQPQPQPQAQYQSPSQPQTTPVPNQNRPQPQKPPTQSRVLQVVQPNTAPPRQQPPTKPIEPMVEPPEPKYDSLLLGLADEYMDAALKLKERTEDYYKLVSLALGCIESVLKNFKLPPLREAQVSLRYAQILYDETENNDDAESVLTKAIDLCQRMKFFDLKYGMQLLLAKVLHRSKPKAALKDLQGMIQDVEAYRHSAWEYAFRLQYVLFAVASSSNTDLHAAITQLERISHVSRQNGDNAEFAFAAILEAMLHLQSPANEATSAAQTALARARSLQLNPDVEKHPQISVMMEFIDMACNIRDHDIIQIEEKRKVMQNVMYRAIDNPGYREDGTMQLHIDNRSLNGVQVQDGGLVRRANGKHFLVLSWLGKEEAEAIGFLLSGVSSAYKNVSDGGKSERFLTEGLQIPRELASKNISAMSMSEILQGRWRQLQLQFLLELALLQCSKGKWTKAQATTKEAEDMGTLLGNQIPGDLEAMMSYVRGCVHQGLGDLTEALAAFQPSVMLLSRQQKDSHLRAQVAMHNISMLAAMNTAFILRSESHPRHHQLQQLMNILDPVVHESNDKNIQASYSFLLATFPSNTILKTKQYLSNALESAKSIGNAQITALTLTMMQERFFKGVVGDQAIKCARAASHQVKTKWGEPMWTAVSAGLEAGCLAVQGSATEAARKNEEAQRVMAMVPEKVRLRIS